MDITADHAVGISIAALVAGLVGLTIYSCTENEAKEAAAKVPIVAACRQAGGTWGSPGESLPEGCYSYTLETVIATTDENIRMRFNSEEANEAGCKQAGAAYGHFGRDRYTMYGCYHVIVKSIAPLIPVVR